MPGRDMWSLRDSYRFPGSYKIEVGLACQTVVQPNMYLTQIPFFPATKSLYDIEKIKPTIETLVKNYPEVLDASSVIPVPNPVQWKLR